jgi:hypothetical protein
MVLMAAVAALVATSLVWVDVDAQQPGAKGAVAIDTDDIGGVVTSSKGPEAGVWVIAETADLSTKLAKIAVTDDQGRYVVPDLPTNASYEVFVRGYGLVDSPRQKAKAGQQLNLTAQIAPDARTAAQVYPAAWWLSMMSHPSAPDEQLRFQQTVKGCLDCHHLGSKATRTFQKYITGATTLEKWDARTKIGPSGSGMSADFQRLGEHRKLFADWTDMVAKGEAPKTAPPRPAGVERNVVLTLWDWGSELDGRADNAASDVRNPRVNANGLIYGVSQPTDGLNILNPVSNESVIIDPPTKAPKTGGAFSPNFGKVVWEREADPRSVAIDGNGDVWFTIRHRETPTQQPGYCMGNNGNKFGKWWPLKAANKGVTVFRAKTQSFEVVDTCFGVDHNELDKQGRLFFGSGGGVAWVDTVAWNKTKNSEQSQGWCPAVVDTNGDGKITPGWTEPKEPVDPTKDHRIQFGCYSIAVNQKDGSLWCSGIGGGDTSLVRIEVGANPPETCKAEIYRPPTGQKLELVGTGGVQSDTHGVVYQAWRVSGHFVEFDRSKCKSTKDPTASGNSCPEGYTIHRQNQPTYANSPYHASEYYLQHIDAPGVLDLGPETPVNGSPNTDSFEAFSSKTKQFVTLRVPYPLGFFPRSGTARIDNPSTGWKGRGFWSSFSTYASWHIEGGKAEGGKGVLPKVVKFQMRPNPLAK